MNAAAAKITSTAVHLQKKENKPFFSKSEDGSFFSKSNVFPQSFFSKSAIQTKLTIGQPNDIYEKEADSMADKVVQRPAIPDVNTKKERTVQAKPVAAAITPIVQTKCATCEQEEKLQKKEDEDEKNLFNDKLQKKPIFESNAKPPDDDSFSFGDGRGEVLQRKCTECDKEEKLQKKSDSTSQTSSPNIESSLNSSKGSGSQLPLNTREQMESSFGADFSNVRIHNDSSSVQMNKDLHAQAFTHGSDIYFNSGKYDSNSNSGKHLLAHELTHVVQQEKNGMLSQKGIMRQVSEDIVHEFERRTNACPDKQRMIQIYNRQAIEWVSETIGQIDNWDSSNVTSTEILFNSYIRNFSPARLHQTFNGQQKTNIILNIIKGLIRDRLASILLSLININYRCANPDYCHSDEQGRYEPQLDQEHHIQTNLIALCPIWFDDTFPELQKITTLIHENAHNNGISDVAYEWMPTYNSMVTPNSFNNADSYAVFTRQVAHKEGIT